MENKKYESYLEYMFVHKNAFNRVAKCILVLALFATGLFSAQPYVAIFSGMILVLQQDHYYRKYVDLHKRS